MKYSMRAAFAQLPFWVTIALVSSHAFAAMPGDPGWGTIDPCTATADFVTVPMGGDPEVTLLSRHTYCTKYYADYIELNMDLMRTSDGNGWEPYVSGTTGREIRTFHVGRMKLNTYFQSYGAQAKLVAPHRIKAQIN